MSEWQPIATAPYDTLVLCLRDSWEWPRVLRRKNGRWDDETTDEDHKPQYWVRIPEPPPTYWWTSQNASQNDDFPG